MTPYHKKLMIQLLIATGVLALLTVVLLVLGSNISRYSVALVQGRQDLLDRSATLQAFAALRSDYNQEVKNDLPLLYTLLPQQDQLINLPKDLQFLAAQDGLTYTFAFGPLTPASDQSFGTVQFQLTLGGTLNELMEFVQRFQKFKYLTKIIAINLSRAGNSYQMSMNAQVSFR